MSQGGPCYLDCQDRVGPIDPNHRNDTFERWITLGNCVHGLMQAFILLFKRRATHVRPEAFRRDDEGVAFFLKPGQLLLVRLGAVLFTKLGDTAFSFPFVVIRKPFEE